MNKKLINLFLALILVLPVSLMSTHKAQGATILVTVTYDGYDQNQQNYCTLRMAIVAANENRQVGRCAAGSAAGMDTISFYQPGMYVLNRSGDDPAVCTDAMKAANQCYYGDLDVTESVMILGSGSGTVLEASNLANRVFHINTPGSVILSNLKILQGVAPTIEAGNTSPGNGGGIYNQQSELKVINSIIEANSGPLGGGGIATASTASTYISGSVLYNNAATIGGALLNNGHLEVVNSLIYGNNATQRGGGLNNNINTGTASFTNVTISSNISPEGSALFSQSNIAIVNSTITANSGAKPAVVVSGTGTILNTAIVGHANGNCEIHNDGFSSLGYNLFDKTDCTIAIGTDKIVDQPDTTKLIGAMDYVSSKETMYIPPADSPMVNGGTNNGCPAYDQRGTGFFRPRTAADVCDIGSYEITAAPPANRVYLPNIVR